MSPTLLKSCSDTMNVAVTARSAGRLTLNVFTDRLVSSTSQDVTPGTANVKLGVGNDWGTGAYLVATLRRPLESVTYETRETTKAAYERSDVCVVPAAGVAAEAMVAFVLAQLALEKFGGASATELKRNYDGYLEQIRNY